MKLPGSSETMQLDLADLNSVRSFAKEFQSKFDRLDTLMNNAGVMHVVGTEREETEDGFELQLGTNHAGHALLTLLLMPVLRATAAAAAGSSGGASGGKNGKPEDDPASGAGSSRADGDPVATPDVRIISVASLAHETGKVQERDPHWLRPGAYKPWLAYSQSKLANLLFAWELQRRFDSGLDPAAAPLRAFSCHPGVVMTELDRNIPNIAWLRPAMYALLGIFLKTPSEGAQTQLYLATAPRKELDRHRGRYFSDCARKPSPNPQAEDPAYAKKMWDLTLPMLGLSEEEAEAAGLGVAEDCRRLGVRWGERVVKQPEAEEDGEAKSSMSSESKK